MVLQTCGFPLRNDRFTSIGGGGTKSISRLGLVKRDNRRAGNMKRHAHFFTLHRLPLFNGSFFCCRAVRCWCISAQSAFVDIFLDGRTKKTHCWCIVIHRCWPLALSGPSACVRWLFGEARCSRVMLYRSANRLLCVWTLILVAFPCSFHCYWPGLLVCLYRGYGKKVLHRYPLVIDSIRLHP